MKKIVSIISLLLFAGLSATACSRLLGGPIDDATIEKFIAAQDKLRAMGAGGGQGGDHAAMEKAVQEAGFESMAAFQKTTAKIAMAFSVIEARGFIEELEKKKTEGLAEIDEQLSRGDLPAETRSQLEASKQRIVQEFEQNKASAEAVVKATGMLVDEESAATVARHRDRLKTALAGQDLKQYQL